MFLSLVWLISVKTRNHKKRICSLKLRKIFALTLSLENRCWVQEHKSGYLRLTCSLTSASCQQRNIEEKLEIEERLPCDICSHHQQLSKTWRRSFISTTGFVNIDKLWVFSHLANSIRNILLPWIPSLVLYCVLSSVYFRPTDKLLHWVHSFLCYSAYVKVAIKFLFATFTTW